MTTAPGERKQKTPNIVVVPDMQLPTAHMARESGTQNGDGKGSVSGSNSPASGIMRAQLRGPVSLFSSLNINDNSGSSTTGSPVPLSTPRTIENFRLPQPGTAATRAIPPTPPPSSWHESLTGFLIRFCSPHQFGLENMSIWHDEIAKIKLPTPTAPTTVQTSAAVGLAREQWIEAENYIKYLAQQLAANNPLTGNLNWAIVHFLANMRCLKTLDFLGTIDNALRNLHFILRIMFKGFSLIVESSKLRKLFADRPIASGTIDLILDKVGALADGEVRAHAFKTTLADTSKLHCQVLQYVMFALAKLDVRTSPSAYMFYMDLLAMLLDLFVPQIYARAIDEFNSLLINELMTTVGSSVTFNVANTLAEEAVSALLANAVAPPQIPTAQGLVLSAYSFLFSRSNAIQTKSLEQHALMLLLMLVSQPDTSSQDDSRNPYMVALERLTDSPKDPLQSSNNVPFRIIFAKMVAEIQASEWSTLLHVLIMRNESFRTYVLARTDTDTLLIPLLKRMSLATAMPIPSSHSQAANTSKKQGDRHYSSTHASSMASGGSTYITLVSELASSTGDSKAQHHSRGLSQSSSSTSSLPSPSIPSISSKTLGSTGHTNPSTSAGYANAGTGSSGSSSLSASSTAASGAKLRQAVLLPYALSVDTVPYVHLYLWMSTLVSLTEDAQFVEQLQRSIVDFWPTSPVPMNKQPLSHCITVELMRIFQLNIMYLKDKYLHSLSLGALVNVLYNTTGISTAISQKLVKLFEMIYRRFSKLANISDLSLADRDERDVYLETLTVLLALFYHLLYTNNAQFIYCLLPANAILGGFREAKKPVNSIQDPASRAVALAAKLRVRVAYFHARISTLTNPQAEDILELIESVIGSENSQSSSNTIAFVCKLPESKQWSAFILPLVWELLLSSGIATVSSDGHHPLLEEFENLVL
ncbi:Dyggve-Melchior-Clausen syndrome protein-domain-containing protein [Coemansia spiralis]|nr:Dyggve-Melchior-Clausen syndrome protein-domain-containing protein [Coemansia spiralis]